MTGENPGEAPKNEVGILKTTRFIDEEGNNVKEAVEGFVDVNKYDHIRNDKGEIIYTFKETTETKDIRTHIYRKAISEIPNDAPKEEVETLKTTRFVDEEGNNVKEAVEGFVDVDKYDHIRNDKGEIVYTFKETTETKDVRTHIYTPVVHEVDVPEINELPEMPLDKVPTYSEVPNEAPTAELPEMPLEEVPTYSETPEDSPISEVPVLKTTRHLVKGTDEVLAVDMDFVDNKGEIVHNGKVYKYVSSLEDTVDLRTHYYEEVVQPTPPSEEPRDPGITPPPSDNPSDPEITPPSDNPSDPEITPPSDNPSDPEITPPSNNPSDPEITPPQGENTGEAEVTPPSDNPSDPEITPPSKGEKTTTPKITKGQALPTTSAVESASIFGAGLIGLIAAAIAARRKNK